MEAFSCPSSAPPFRTFFSYHPAQQSTSTQLLLPSKPHKQRHAPPFRPSPRTQAVNNAFGVAANLPTPAGGDISVLFPVSALLIFIYWITNFVVPEMITKDFQPTAEEPKPSEDNYTIMNKEPKLKIKKGSIKKKMSQRP